MTKQWTFMLIIVHSLSNKMAELKMTGLITKSEIILRSCFSLIPQILISTVIQNVANFSLVRLFGFRYFTYLLLPDWNLSSIS
ncbi:unnamed protein product [Schistosoma bovis]|nr:unnamed protein product [Schistosoma bovis]